MVKYVLHRLLLAVPTLLGLTILLFFLIRVLVPVDMIQVANATQNDPELEARLRQEFGLTGTLPQQYLGWLARLITGDLGRSLFAAEPISSELAQRIPTSMELGFGALIVTLIVAIPIGVISAVKQDSAADYASRGSAILLYAVPGFWLATLVLIFGSTLFNWAPAIDYEPVWVDPVANVTQLWLPMLLLAIQPTGSLVRLVRTQVLEVLRQDYVRTARAKGLPPLAVYTRHVLRNSMLPIVTVVGLQVPSLLAGSVIFEQIFVIPGVGQYLVEAVRRLDLYVIMAANLVIGVSLILSNIAVDVSYGFIDPRVRLTG